MKYTIDEIKKDLESRLSEKRYKHSLSVAEYAKKIAKANNVDENKAYLAGLIHDCTKEKDENWHDECLIKHNDIQKTKYKDKIKHGFTSKYYANEVYGIDDKEILNASYNHVLCEEETTLNKIIFIADKREPLRKIEDDVTKYALIDINKAFILLKEDIKRYLNLKNIINLVDTKQGENIVTIDFTKNSPFIDYFIVCSAKNSRHANSIIEELDQYACKNNLIINTKNTGKEDKWMLIDINGIVIHLFVDDERSKYSLENLWKDLIIEI